MIPLDDDAWDAWSPDELHQRLREATSPWYVAGGWALDVWHGEATRAHQDLEFVALREDANAVRALLPELDFFTVKDGAFAFLPPSENPPDDVWQLWGADRRHGCWRVDLMLEPGTPDLWIYKRDRTIRIPRADAVRRGGTGIPHLAPALVMLFKAKYERDKDQADFDLFLRRSSAEEKDRLLALLRTLHPEHKWIGSLTKDRQDGGPIALSPPTASNPES